ncbi:hypothetical protein GCM10010329_77420 [Streptomyces spiroverticillatus]|uniref:Class F sortase n=1 Tax=Streptomyces finlayi TaxID=67296 RepID=A0A918X660_9ACTN|nr:class F sortase [Streptomyces finlayi]GHA43005.1 hypothetical protein GCM10010329_77420 [Streptomyces spiroverticillatus]GHD13984.1 hypothetical protein GCM10010334_72830 [Streptomyces finlayi]
MTGTPSRAEKTWQHLAADSAGTNRRRRALLAASAALTVAAGTILVVGVARQEPGPPQAAPATSTTAGSAPPSGHSHHPSTTPSANDTVLPPSPPKLLSIPALAVRSTLERLGLDARRAMQTPRDPDKAGWFTPGPSPGEKGPAVIAGHVTWNDEPAVFLRLGALKKDQRIEITRADGRTAVFAVERTARYPKDKFPTVEVYKNLDHAGLRLITCGGDYSRTTHRYSDNVVVYASLIAVR